MKQARTPSRNRVLYACLTFTVVGTGLLWRADFMPLSPLLSKYGGDALWALMLFMGCAFLFPRASTIALGLMALSFAWTVEFSQIYHAPWIDALRVTLPGRLILGSTFNWPDLPAYLLGIALGVWAELWHGKMMKRPVPPVE